MKKILLILLALPLLGISWLLIDQYVLCPTIQFPASKPFAGKSIYNPYQHIDSSDIAVANFHAHTKAWKGLTNGKGNGGDVWRRYDSLSYTFHAVSQYFNIDTFNHNQGNYIPVYEHGINFKKTHQLVIGASKVQWKDYVFPQSIHNKQHIINKIAEDPNVLIALNHPDMLSGYKREDFEQLYNYDFIEVLNPQAQSFSAWDAALSSGHPVFALANDDVHDVFDNKLLGKFYNIVFAAKSNRYGLMTSLKEGNYFTVWAPEGNENLKQKRSQIESVKNILQSVAVHNDLFEIHFSSVIDTIRLIGQHGKLMDLQTRKTGIGYHFMPSDTYVRVELIQKNGTRLYLNPFFRY
jgi:hypothetical protein